MLSVGSSLSDHHGAWCAWCLHYLSATPSENHHMYPEWSTEDSLAQQMLAWTVPVHRELCHRERIQRPSNAAGYTLKVIQAKSEKQLARVAKVAFDNGNLNLALLLELELIRHSNSIDYFEGSCVHLLNFVAAAAGSSQRQAIDYAFDLVEPDKTINRASTYVKARWALSMGNLERNSKNIDLAAPLYSTAAGYIESLGTPARTELRPAYLRRIVALKPSVSGARKAVESARATPDPWGQRTANLVEGWSNLAVGRISEARGCFEPILMEPRSLVSWWHLAEANFGVGLCCYASDDRRTTLKHCLRSQYIRAVLGLCGDNVVGVGLGGCSMQGGLRPDLVIELVRLSNPNAFKRDQMTDIRLDVLGSTLQQDLLNDLRADGLLNPAA